MTKQKVNILMVDDRPENLLALEAVLTSPAYNLVSVTSGEQALKYVLQEDFAVILLDVQMPGMNGYETAKMIKSRDKSRNIPIVFITAINHSSEYVTQGYSVGAIDYIVKPFHAETLRLKVEQFVKIYQEYKQAKEKSELLGTQTLQLKQTSDRLNRTTLDLRKTQALTRVIGETALDTIVTFDKHGFIITVNPAVTNMYGYSVNDLVGEHIATLFRPNCSGDQNAIMITDTPVSSLVGKIAEVTAIRKDEGKFPAEIQIGQASVDDEKIYVCSIRDISERIQLELEREKQCETLEKLAEARTLELLAANIKLQQEIEERNKIAENLRFSEARFRVIFEASPCMIAIKSLHDDRYLDVNPAWLDYTGYSRAEIINQTADKLNVTIVFREPQEPTDDCSEYQQSCHNVRIQYVTKAGQLREALLSVENIEVEGEKCQLRVIIDITERVLLENKMARFDRLSLIGEMAAGIAHEIRNPMTTVKGFLQLTQRRGNIAPMHIKLMIEELDRANAIITEFLSLAKDRRTETKPQSLTQIVENLFPLVQAEAMRSGKYVNLDIAPCPDLCLDEKEIRQLVLNLAINGLEAMAAGGRLTIRTYREAENVVLEVRDQGRGINPELLDKIGTPFFTTKEQGTGLGLAICYSVAARHGAVIEVDTCSEGTAFFVRFATAG